MLNGPGRDARMASNPEVSIADARTLKSSRRHSSLSGRKGEPRKMQGGSTAERKKMFIISRKQRHVVQTMLNKRESRRQVPCENIEVQHDWDIIQNRMHKI